MGAWSLYRAELQRANFIELGIHLVFCLKNLSIINRYFVVLIIQGLSFHVRCNAQQVGME
jgi:hypothetical protein